MSFDTKGCPKAHLLTVLSALMSLDENLIGLYVVQVTCGEGCVHVCVWLWWIDHLILRVSEQPGHMIFPLHFTKSKEGSK